MFSVKVQILEWSKITHFLENILLNQSTCHCTFSEENPQCLDLKGNNARTEEKGAEKGGRQDCRRSVTLVKVTNPEDNSVLGVY